MHILCIPKPRHFQLKYACPLNMLKPNAIYKLAKEEQCYCHLAGSGTCLHSLLFMKHTHIHTCLCLCIYVYKERSKQNWTNLKSNSLLLKYLNIDYCKLRQLL